MNTANRLFVISLATLVAAGVLFAAAAGLFWLAPNPPAWSGPEPLSETDGVARQPRKAAKPVISAHALARAQEDLSRLSEALRETEALLQRRTESLREKDAQCDALERELDETITFYFASLEQADGQPSSMAAELARQLKAVQTEYQSRSAEWRERAGELERLRTHVTELEQRLTEMQLAAEEEVGLLLRDRAALEEGFLSTLERIDTDPVLALTSLLSEPRPSVRAWAARILGNMGADAATAAPRLELLLLDEDEQVRTAAREALQAID